MIVTKPQESKQMPDGVYLGRVDGVKETKSKLNGAPQFEIQFSLNTRDRTLVWVNQSTKGFDILFRSGIASEHEDGQVEVKEADVLAGVVVTRAKAMIVPASTAVQMNPALKPLFEQVAQKYTFK